MATKKIKTSEDKAHAQLSPSSAKRWLNCSASIEHCKNIPEPPEGPAAAEGTLAHSVLETVLKARVGGIKRFKYPTGTTQEMIGHAEDAAAWIMKEFKPQEGDEIQIETKSDLTYLDSEFWGTLDVSILRFLDRLTIIDYKYGRGLVDVVDDKGRPNEQLMVYAVGKLREFDWAFEEVELVVIQPRKKDAKGKTIRSHVFKVSEAKSFEGLLEKGIKRVRTPSMRKFFAGDHCTFCRGQATCDAYKKSVGDHGAAAFDDAPPAGAIVAVSNKSMITPKSIAAELKRVEHLLAYKKKLEDLALKMIRGGQKVPGYAEVEMRASRRWKSVAKAEGWAVHAIGDDAFELRSVADIEKMLPKKYDRKKFEAHVVSVSSGTRLGKAGHDARDVFDDGFVPVKSASGRKGKSK